MATLRLSTFKPRWHDKRTRRRVRDVLSYCKGMLDHETVRGIMMKDLRVIFGNPSEKGETLAKWLMANLLEREFFYSVGQFPYSYRVKAKGYAKVLKLLEEAENEFSR